MEMTKKEFVQRFILKRDIDGEWIDKGIERQIDEAIRQYDLIEEAFAEAPTKNLWDYNDRN